MEIKDVEKLVELSRIEVSDEEKENLAKDLESILGYIKQIELIDVNQVNQAQPSPKAMAGAVNQVKQAPEHVNIMREDRDSHQPLIYTEKLIDEAPDTKDGYIKVQKIL